MPYKDPEIRKAYHRAYGKKYRQSANGKALIKKYQQTYAYRAAQKARRQTAVYKVWSKKYRQTPTYKAGMKKFLQSLKGKAYLKRRQQKYRQKYPEKYKCLNAVNNAVRDGKLVRQPCSVCGAADAQFHHSDYSRPFEVLPLCQRDHTAETLRQKLEVIS